MEPNCNPHNIISGVMLCQLLNYQAPGSKVVGRKGIQDLSANSHGTPDCSSPMKYPCMAVIMHAVTVALS